MHTDGPSVYAALDYDYDAGGLPDSLCTRGLPARTGTIIDMPALTSQRISRCVCSVEFLIFFDCVRIKAENPQKPFFSKPTRSVA